MDLILKRSLLNFKRELKAATTIVTDKPVPAELNRLREWILSAYKNIEDGLNQLEYYIGLNDSDLHEDILSNFSSLQTVFRIISTKYLPAIYRNHDNDLLALKLLTWLHNEHSQTKNQPFFIQDGDFSILTGVGYPLGYYLPVISQQGLLFLPLFFHEIGHYFYKAHKPEMDALVQELQTKLGVILQPPFKSNNQVAKDQADKAQRIVETWYEWTQEFFCDAVGLEIGGKTYLNAFSYYLRMQGQNSLQLPEKNLANSSHPVNWLRIKFLAERARRLGLIAEADALEKSWQKIADTLKINEEYFGYYSPKYHQAITETIDNMLVEAAPVSFGDYVTTATGANSSYIQLIHEAWDNFESDPEQYDQWERSIVRSLLKNQI